MQRILNSEDITIMDGSNYIKGIMFAIQQLQSFYISKVSSFFRL